MTAFCPVPELPHPLNSLTGQDSLWPSANWNTSQQYYLHFVVHAVSLSSNPDLPRHERHTELMASGGRQPARVLGTCWPQLWPGHTAAGGKRATLVPSFPPLSLSLHLPPLLSEHQSKSRRIRPKRYFEGLEICIYWLILFFCRIHFICITRWHPEMKILWDESRMQQRAVEMIS